MKEMLFNVDGMSCDHCVQTLSTALDGVAGVSDRQVSLAEGTARVRFDEGACEPKAVIDAIRSSGFQVTGFARVD